MKYDNVIKQKVRKCIKHVKNVVQSWYKTTANQPQWHVIILNINFEQNAMQNTKLFNYRYYENIKKT